MQIQLDNGTLGTVDDREVIQLIVRDIERNGSLRRYIGKLVEKDLKTNGELSRRLWPPSR